MGTLRGSARTQSQLAVGVGDRGWCLLNASPDLRAQIEATAALHPRNGLRDTPIESVILTNADLDHVLGLLLMREFQPLRIYSTPAVRKILTEDNSVFQMLRQLPEQLVWKDIHPGQPFELGRRDGTPLGVRCEPISVAWSFPPYVSAERRAGLAADEAVLGLILEPTGGGRRLAYFPGLPEANDPWLERMENCDLLLVDGTFWTDDELARTRGGGRTAREMGHLPLSGAEGSLARLASLKRPRKIFTHINNTNPILNDDSAEHGAVREAGWEVARDGMEFTL